MIQLAVALILCAGFGAALVSLAWGRGSSSGASLGMKLSLSLGYGIAIFSIVFFLCLVLGIKKLFAADLLVLTLIVIVNFLLRRRLPMTSLPPAENSCFPRWLRNIIIAAFSIALVAAVYDAIVRAIAYPHGDGWDAFAIWNLRARFLFRGGVGWRDGFTSLLPWSHPDYPLLLPSATAHFWSYVGHESPAVPVLIGLIFTFGTVVFLFSSLALLRHRDVAMLGTLALLATPFFIEQGTSQYADVPLAFFFLAAIALLSLHDAVSADVSHNGFLVLAGLAAGFAAWTKNEGLLFVGALLVAHLVVLARPMAIFQGRRAFAILLASVIPTLLLIAWFKHSLAPPGDILVSSNPILPKFVAVSRYWAICKWYGKEFFRFGGWLGMPGTVLLGILYWAGGKGGMSGRPGFRTGVLTLGLTLAGYFVVYLITPYDIYWHLRFSLSRLFLQLWPSAIFLFFLRCQLGPRRPALAG